MSLFRNKIIISYSSMIAQITYLPIYLKKSIGTLSSLMKNASSSFDGPKGLFSLKFRGNQLAEKKVEKRFSDDLPLPLTNFHATLRTQTK